MNEQNKTTDRSTPAQSTKSQTTKSPNAKKMKEIKRHLLSTGLADYGFWWQEMAKVHSTTSDPDRPFRRGRIWG